MMKRRDFIAGSTAFVLAPAFVANGRPLKKYLALGMTDTMPPKKG